MAQREGSEGEKDQLMLSREDVPANQEARDAPPIQRGGGRMPIPKAEGAQRNLRSEEGRQMREPDRVTAAEQNRRSGSLSGQ